MKKERFSTNEKPERAGPGRPPKGPRTKEEQYAYSLVRCVQCSPYNASKAGHFRTRWQVMKLAIQQFMKETHRPHLQNALYVLLEQAIHEYRRQNPALYPDGPCLSALDNQIEQTTEDLLS